MARLVRDEAGMHADERQHENRQRTRGNTRTGQQRRVGRRIARQDERAVSSGARGGRAETSRTGELRDQRAVKRSEEHTSELQSPCNLVCRLLLEKKK